MRPTVKEMDDFTERLTRHAQNKAEQYDGLNPDLSVEMCLIYLMEEAGEVADAVVRKRFDLALTECIDVAHTAMLVYLSIKQIEEKGD